MMIEEGIASRILHQQKDVIAKHLEHLQEAMRENHAREDVVIDNGYSCHHGEPGMYVRLEYSKKCRSWSLQHGEALDDMSRYWASEERFLHYDDSDESNWIWLAEQMIEGVLQNALEEDC